MNIAALSNGGPSKPTEEQAVKKLKIAFTMSISKCLKTSLNVLKQSIINEEVVIQMRSNEADEFAKDYKDDVDSGIADYEDIEFSKKKDKKAGSGKD